LLRFADHTVESLPRAVGSHAVRCTVLSFLWLHLCFFSLLSAALRQLRTGPAAAPGSKASVGAHSTKHLDEQTLASKKKSESAQSTVKASVLCVVCRSFSYVPFSCLECWSSSLVFWRLLFTQGRRGKKDGGGKRGGERRKSFVVTPRAVLPLREEPLPCALGCSVRDTPSGTFNHLLLACARTGGSARVGAPATSRVPPGC